MINQKRNFYRIAVFLNLLGTSGHSWSNNLVELCRQQPAQSRLVFINGINTLYEESAEAARKTAEKINKEYKAGKKRSFAELVDAERSKIIYQEAAFQKGGGAWDKIVFFCFDILEVVFNFLGQVTNYLFDLFSVPGSKLNSYIPFVYHNEVNLRLATSEFVHLVRFSDDPLLIVSYSQGNFLANVMLKRLVSEPSYYKIDLGKLANFVSRVGVGVPSSYIIDSKGDKLIDHNYHVTNSRDLIATFLPFSISPNWEAPLKTQFLNDILGHSYEKIYLGENSPLVRKLTLESDKVRRRAFAYANQNTFITFRFSVYKKEEDGRYEIQKLDFIEENSITELKKLKQTKVLSYSNTPYFKTEFEWKFSCEDFNKLFHKDQKISQSGLSNVLSLNFKYHDRKNENYRCENIDVSEESSRLAYSEKIILEIDREKKLDSITDKKTYKIKCDAVKSETTASSDKATFFSVVLNSNGTITGVAKEDVAGSSWR